MAADANLTRFRAVVAAGLAQLEARRQEVNDLNVFPVADGDTGDNMALTLRSVLGELDRLLDEQQDRSIDEIGRDEIVDAVARRRAARRPRQQRRHPLPAHPRRGGGARSAAPASSSTRRSSAPPWPGRSTGPYASVRAPAEGTILTVAREMAHRIAAEIAHMDDPSVAPERARRGPGRSLAEILERALEAGQESVRRTPDLLPVLKDAGVVDAGGHALTVIMAGVIAALRGTEAPDVEHHIAPARVTHPEHASETYRYCTNFAVTGSDPRRGAVPRRARGRRRLDPRGGRQPDAEGARPHRRPVVGHRALRGRRRGVAPRRGRHAPADDRAGRAAAGHNGDAPELQRCGVLAVCSGAGMRQLFESFGAHVVDGGPTLNPSTYELLAGIHEVPPRRSSCCRTPRT
jgi:dihydroxyacetone kinase-like predicted kinase